MRKYDGHYNARGHRIIVQCVWQHLYGNQAASQASGPSPDPAVLLQPAARLETNDDGTPRQQGLGPQVLETAPSDRRGEF